jgi:hypothetical protein
VRLLFTHKYSSPTTVTIGIKKVKANQSEQNFLDLVGSRTKVTVEVLGKKNLSNDEIWACIKPGSGIKTIND